MNVNISKVNEQLARKYGSGVVSLIKSSNPSRPYTLRFEEDNPSNTLVKGACATVKKMTGIVFFMSEARHV